MTASPRTVLPPLVAAMRFSGVPAKRSRKCGDHRTATPQLAGMKALTLMPRRAKMLDPLRIGAETRPARPAKRQDHGIPCFSPVQRDLSLNSDTQAVEPAQPGAQQRRGLHRLRKDPAR